MSDSLREKFAAQAHESWSGWMRYLFSKSTFIERGAVLTEDGPCVAIPLALVQRWKRQMETPYDQLPESEKESDRKEADQYLALRSAPCHDEDDAAIEVEVRARLADERDPTSPLYAYEAVALLRIIARMRRGDDKESEPLQCSCGRGLLNGKCPCQAPPAGTM